MKKRKYGKIILFTAPIKSGGASKIVLDDLTVHWIPNSFIKGYDFLHKELTIDTFILKQKNIKYK